MGTNKIPKIVHCQEAYAFMYIGERSIVHAHLPARSRVRTTFFCLSTRLLPSSYVCPCVHIVSFVGPYSSGWSVARSRPAGIPARSRPAGIMELLASGRWRIGRVRRHGRRGSPEPSCVTIGHGPTGGCAPRPPPGLAAPVRSDLGGIRVFEGPQSALARPLERRSAASSESAVSVSSHASWDESRRAAGTLENRGNRCDS